MHGDELQSFTAARGEITKDWLRIILDWETDQEKPEAERVGAQNPYEMPKGGKFSSCSQHFECVITYFALGMSESDVRLKLAEEEATQAAAGSFPLHAVGPSAFISQLLELQDQQ